MRSTFFSFLSFGVENKLAHSREIDELFEERVTNHAGALCGEPFRFLAGLLFSGRRMLRKTRAVNF